MGKIVTINMVIDFHKKVMKISPSDLAKNVDSSQGMVIANMEEIANIFMVIDFHKKVMKFSPGDLAKNVDSSEGMVIAVMGRNADIFMMVEILYQRMEPNTKRSRKRTEDK